MGFLDKIFGGNDAETTPDFWHFLESEEDLKAAIEESYKRKVVLFKHSTRCHISKTVLRNFEREVDDENKDIAYYFLDLLSYRNLSNQIADQFDVVHQSPQMIVLKDGKAVLDASHQSISTSLL